MTSYLAVQYSMARQPMTDFPSLLIDMLIRRCGLEPSLMVEVGPGRGDWVQRGFQVIPVDFEHLLPGTMSVDLERDRWATRLGRHVELVFQKSVIEHLHSPTLMLRECHNALMPGGLLILMCPDWRTYMKTFYDDYTHRQPYDHVSLQDVLEANGFTEVKVERIYQYPPFWRYPALTILATLWRWITPVEFSLWLSNRTGWGCFRWSSQLTLLATARRPR
jgi:SAM-dependent methyltransferase